LWVLCWIRYFAFEMIVLYENLVLNDPFDPDFSCRPPKRWVIEEIRCGWAMCKFVLCLYLFIMYFWSWVRVLKHFNHVSMDVKNYQQTLAIDIFEEHAEDLADLMAESAPMTVTMQKIQEHWNNRSKALTTFMQSNKSATDVEVLAKRVEEDHSLALQDLQVHKKTILDKLQVRRLASAAKHDAAKEQRKYARAASIQKITDEKKEKEREEEDKKTRTEWESVMARRTEQRKSRRASTSLPTLL